MAIKEIYLLRWFKGKSKQIYLILISKVAKLFVPPAYITEIDFFEKIRGGLYTDKSYQETQLRSAVHQIDKGLTCNRLKGKESYSKIADNLLKKLEKDSAKETNSIKWAKNVLSEYKIQLESERIEASEEKFYKHNGYDNEDLKKLEKVIKSRRSIRSFKDKSINERIRNKILEAGLWAPSGCNRQNIEYLVLTEKDDIKFCQRMAGEGHSFPRMASFCVVVLVDCRSLSLPGQRHMAYLEAGAAIQNMLLYAHCAGIGSCWLFWAAHRKNEEFWRKFDLNPWLLPVSMVSFGYSMTMPKFIPVRKELGGVIHFPR